VIGRMKMAGIPYWAANVILTAALGWLLSALRVPSGWLIAALVSAGAVAMLTGRQLTPAPVVLRPAQGCIGVLAISPLAGVAAPTMARYLGVSLVCSGATLVICLVCTLVLVRVAKTLSPATALLSTLAGGASGISTMAPELRVDHRYVALSQYLRLMVVTLTLPFVLELAGPGSVGPHGGGSRRGSLSQFDGWECPGARISRQRLGRSRQRACHHKALCRLWCRRGRSRLQHRRHF